MPSQNQIVSGKNFYERFFPKNHRSLYTPVAIAERPRERHLERQLWHQITDRLLQQQQLQQQQQLSLRNAATTYDQHFGQPARDRHTLDERDSAEQANKALALAHPLYGTSATADNNITFWTFRPTSGTNKVQPLSRTAAFTRFAHGECWDQQYS